MKELDYLSLARQATIDRKPKLFWMHLKNHARVQRKLWANEKRRISPDAYGPLT
jgi:hypothetical protein